MQVKDYEVEELIRQIERLLHQLKGLVAISSDLCFKAVGLKKLFQNTQTQRIVVRYETSLL